MVEYRFLPPRKVQRRMEQKWTQAPPEMLKMSALRARKDAERDLAATRPNADPTLPRGRHRAPDIPNASTAPFGFGLPRSRRTT